MTLEEVFDIARSKRYLVVSTVNEFRAPEAALMGFALTQAKEIVFDTLSTSRKAVNLERDPAAALVIGWDDNMSLQIEGKRADRSAMTWRAPRRLISKNGRTVAHARIGPASLTLSCSRSGYDTPTIPELRWSRSSSSKRRIPGSRPLP